MRATLINGHMYLLNNIVLKKSAHVQERSLMRKKYFIIGSYKVYLDEPTNYLARTAKDALLPILFSVVEVTDQSFTAARCARVVSNVNC